LGPEQFGTLVLIHTYVLVVAGVVKFRSWQAVIRYGAGCLAPERKGDFQKLLKFTTLLDFGSGIVGALVAFAFAPVAGKWMGWDADTTALATSYGWLILFMIEATPTGVLRLFDRFNLLAFQSIVTPFLRLVGVTAAYFAGAGLAEFVVVWFVSAAAGRLVLLVLGWAELVRQKMLAGIDFSVSGLSKPHKGLWRFVLFTNFNASVELIVGHATTLVVGGVLGTAEAGLFKIAQEFTKALAKPTQLLAQTVFPDIAKLWAEGKDRKVGKLVLRAGLVAGCAATGIFAFLAAFGEQILELTVGPEYLAAFGVMVLLALSKALSVFGFPLTPALYAMGYAGQVLRIRIMIALVYIPILFILLNEMSVAGAGVARIAFTLATVVFTAIVVKLAIDGRLKHIPTR